ncbi:MAG: nitroreductase family protein [Prevotella sp.]
MKTLTRIFSIACMAAMMACSQQSEAQQKTNETTKEQNGNVVVETIMARRSVRKYADKPVEREKLELLVKCGINAPNGMNRQPWEVRVVDNADFINGVTEIFKKAQPKMAQDASFKNMFRNAPAVIFIASPEDGSGQIDCGLMGGNIVVAAQSMGLGTCCLGGPINFLNTNTDAAPYLQRLELSEGYKLLYAIAVGYPGESPQAKPRDENKVKFVK